MDPLTKSIDFLAHITFVELDVTVTLLIGTVFIRRHLSIQNRAISYLALI